MSLSGTELTVLLGGIGVIGLLWWFFFGPKEGRIGGVRGERRRRAGGPRHRRHDLRGLRVARREGRAARAGRRPTRPSTCWRTGACSPTTPPRRRRRSIAAAIEKIGFEAAPLTPEHAEDGPCGGRRERWRGAFGRLPCSPCPVLVGAMGRDMGCPCPPWLALAVGAASADHPGAVLGGRAVLPGRVAVPAAARQRHEHADRAGDGHGLPVLAGGRRSARACSARPRTSITRPPTSSSRCCCWAGCWKRGRRAGRARPSRRCSACSPRPRGW